MKIAFFGLPLAAYLLTLDGHELVLASLSRKGAPGGRRVRALLGDDRVLARPRLDAAFVARLSDLRPDLVVSWFWTQKIPPAVVRLAPLGAFGVHPSLLPRHRGPDPTTWTILRGDAQAGVTAHLIAPEYDTGAILASRTIAVQPTWTSWQLARALDRPSLALLREVCARFARGDAPSAAPQEESLATEAPFLEPDETAIDWSRSAAEVERFVRALSPSPGAATFVGDDPIVLTRVRVVAAPRLLEAPGEAMVEAGRVLIRAADGAVEVLAAEREGHPLTAAQVSQLFAT